MSANLGLVTLLAGAGQPVRVGSSALGLMVRPDLDITVVCDALDLSVVLRIGTELARHSQVRQIVFRNDTGTWNVDPAYPDGLYLGVAFRPSAGADWNIDIWFVDQPERQPDLGHLRSMPSRLDTASVLAILRIKSEWANRPEYGRTVRSFDVYRAVLDHGVLTIDAFSAWLRERSR